jgi:hypothetical protein
MWPKPAPPEVKNLEPDPAVLATKPGESLVLEADAEEVFRRAFWRQPSDQDLIIHAERREWAETRNQHLNRWQWFIQLKPGSELLGILREDGKFDLKLSPTPRSWSLLAPPPPWFPQRNALTGYQVYQSSRGGITVFHLPEKNLLFATDEGYGMASPVLAE